MFVLSVGNTFH
ncbi:unnamed protein product [Staurois parvus]|uniref:Uncharacterized protein n=1 Tax=Staurois parvus TaxID=386267 RepID=A0ABN9FZP1_9NEOB|nr:unnamed protein product [Staurois parvus]